MQNDQFDQRDASSDVSDGAKEMTETDARISIWKPSEGRANLQAQKQIEVPAVVGKDDEEYNMRHPRRGTAIIFNHEKFERMDTRSGSKKDTEVLVKTFQDLGFHVRLHVDLTRDKLFSVLEDTAKEDHSDCDCLVVTVMTHGDPGYLHCYDNLYRADCLWEQFTADNCPSLAGKPKLFFIQACRGTKTDAGARMMLRMTDEVDSGSAWYTIPACADILIAYSTVEGYYSWRDPTHGSWFIQVLCEQLQKHGRTRDVQSILTLVCRRVATDFQSYVPGNESMDLKKQIPAITSMLTRQVFFH